MYTDGSQKLDGSIAREPLKLVREAIRVYPARGASLRTANADTVQNADLRTKIDTVQNADLRTNVDTVQNADTQF